MVWPAEKFKFDVAGLATPSANAVKLPAALGPATVTLITAAPTPLAGTPPRPAICSLKVPRAGTAPAAPRAERVSSTRAGRSEFNPPDAARPVANHPDTSPTTCTLPGEALYRSILPSAPTWDTTRLEMVWPAEKFTFDVAGLDTPSANTVRTPAALGAATVTLITTAPTPLAGTAPRPAICSLRVPRAGTGPGAPSPERVSSTRAGRTGFRPFVVGAGEIDVDAAAAVGAPSASVTTAAVLGRTSTMNVATNTAATRPLSHRVVPPALPSPQILPLRAT